MHFGWKKCLSSTPVKKMRKYLSNVHKMVGAHLQCMNNHWAKFEYKGMKTFGVTDYTNLRYPKSVADRLTDGVDPVLDLLLLK